MACSRSPIYLFTMPIQVFTMPIWVFTIPIWVFTIPIWLFTMIRGCCSRWSDLGVHDGPKHAASKALSHTITMSAVKSLYTKRIPWQRTNKFPALPLGLGALTAAKVELLLGVALLCAGIGALALLPHPGLLLLLVIGGLYQSLSYLTAPALAVLAERDVVTKESRVKGLPSEGAHQPVTQATGSTAATG